MIFVIILIVRASGLPSLTLSHSGKRRLPAYDALKSLLIAAHGKRIFRIKRLFRLLTLITSEITLTVIAVIAVAAERTLLVILFKRTAATLLTAFSAKFTLTESSLFVVISETSFLAIVMTAIFKSVTAALAVIFEPRLATIIKFFIAVIGELSAILSAKTALAGILTPFGVGQPALLRTLAVIMTLIETVALLTEALVIALKCDVFAELAFERSVEYGHLHRRGQTDAVEILVLIAYHP